MFYIKKQNKTAITKKESKQKEKKKEKKRKEAKRKRLHLESNLGPTTHRAILWPLGNVEHAEKIVENILLKPFALELPPARPVKS